MNSPLERKEYRVGLTRRRNTRLNLDSFCVLAVGDKSLGEKPKKKPLFKSGKTDHESRSPAADCYRGLTSLVH